MIDAPQELRKTLKEIGFDLAEQQVIIYLFKNGVSNIADIAKGVTLPRSTIHLAVEGLIVKNVLATTTIGKRRMVYIEKPEKIKNYVEFEQQEVSNKMSKLEGILPDLRSLFALRGVTEKIDIEQLEGEDGVVEVFLRSLEQDKGGEVLRISGDTEKFTVARDRLKSYSIARQKKGITSRLIIPETPMAQDEIMEARIKMRETRVLPKSMFNPNLQFSVWKNHVAFIIWDQGLHCTIITNKSISEFMKMLFEIAWNQAKISME